MKTGNIKVPFTNLYNETLYKLVEEGRKYKKVGWSTGVLQEGPNAGFYFDIKPDKEVYVSANTATAPAHPPVPAPVPEKKKAEKPRVTVDYLGIKFKEGYVNGETIEQLTAGLALMRKKARLYKRFSKEHNWEDSK